MAKFTEHLTSISPASRSGPSPGRRAVALVLCVMIAFGSTFPGAAVASEADSEGEGTALPIEAPGPPDFDPGGEEVALEEAPASGGEESGAVEAEPQVDPEASAPGEVTNAATESAVEDAQPPPPAEEVPELATPVEPESVPRKKGESPASEPVANQSLVAPKHKPAERRAADDQPASSREAPPAVMPSEEEAPPQPVAATAVESGRHLAGKASYIVGPGDCLWHIAVSLLPEDASSAEIAREVRRLWRLNEDRIGTGNPSLIYAGTELRLH
jgi:outer membrane biosynthesis protein TonB